MNNMPDDVFKKKMKKGRKNKNPGNFKLDCPNCYKYSLVPLQVLNVPKGEEGLKITL